jgi:imidazolonepropionase-like amidohydrolase
VLLDPKSPLAPMLSEGAMADNMARAFEGSLKQVGQAIKAGVPVLAGSDGGNPATFHGISLIRELELLAQAGMPLTDVLKAATSRPAERLGQSSLGRIAPNAVADLVVLDADPTEDVRAYRRVHAVYLGGRSIAIADR